MIILSAYQLFCISLYHILKSHCLSISTTCLLCLVFSICLPHSQLHIIFHTVHYTCKSFPLPRKAILFTTFQPQNPHWNPLFAFSSSWVLCEIPDYLKTVLKGLINSSSHQRLTCKMKGFWIQPLSFYKHRTTQTYSSPWGHYLQWDKAK